MALEPFTVLEWVVHLRVRHRTGFEPAVEHLGNAAHHRLPGRVVGVRADQVVDHRAMQIGRTHTEVCLQLIERSVDVRTRVLRIVRHPHRDRAAPVAVSADVPVACTFEPLAELAVTDVLGHPRDVLVQLDHAIAELGDRDEPRGNRHVDERLPTAPTVRVRVLDRLVPQQLSSGLEVLDDDRVGVEDHQALVRRNHRGELSTRIERLHDLDTVGRGDIHILLTESRCEVDDSGSGIGCHVVGRKHDVRVRMSEEEVERRCVRQSDQLGALVTGNDLGVLPQLTCVMSNPCFREHVPLSVLAEHLDVVDLGMNRSGQVGRQCPRSRGPDDRVCAVQW
eukprot:gene25117-biopygen21665